MSTNIDQLQIEINAQATKANDAIDRLVGKLDRLSGSLNNIDGSKLTGLANGVQKLGTAMQVMNQIGTADFTRLANNLQKMGNIDVAKLDSAASSMSHLTRALNNIGDVSESAQKLGDLAKGIAQLGYTSSTKAIENIPKLADAMKGLMATLSKAPKVSQNIIDMTNALAKLARTGSSSGKAATSLSKSLSLFSNSSSTATKKSFNLASAIGKLYATYWLLFRAFSKLGDAINISSDLTEVQNVVDVTFGKYASLVEKMSETSITDFGMSELTVKQVSSRFQAMGTAMGFAQGKMADMSIELTKLTADMASFYNMEQSDVAEDLASVFTGQTRPLRTYALDLTEATLKEWAMKQGLDANIDSMSQAEKTMLRYQYVMANTGAAQGDFLRTQDTWANKTRILKQNLEQLGSVIGGSLINALKPLVSALNVVIGKFTEFAQVVSDSLGKIFGWKYESGGGVTSDLETGEESADGISSGLGDAANNAKKLKNQLSKLDELNVINTQSDSGSGSGSGSGSASGATGTGTDGQWVRTESILDGYESELDTLYKLGEYISEKLTKALNDIDWDNVYQGARNFGKGLADFLNGLISPELFGAVGKTIANSLNTAIYAALSFGETFDFYEFGESIATGINEFFSNFDAKSLAKTLNTWVGGLEDTIAGFLENMSWKNILKKAGDFLGELDLGTITAVIGLLTISKIGKFVFGGGLAKEIATSIASKIAIQLGTTPVISVLNAGFKAMFGSQAAQSALVFMFPKTATILSTVSTWVTGTLAPALSGIGSTIAGIITGPWGIAIAAAFAGILLIVSNWDSVVEFAGVAWEKVTEIFSIAGEWFTANVSGPLSDVFNGLCDSVSKFFENLWKDITLVWKTASQWFSNNVIEPVVSFFKGLFTRVEQIFEGLWIIVQAVWIVVSSWFDENVITPVVGFFKDLWKSVSDFFTQLWEDIKGVWSIVSEWFNKNVTTPVTNFFKGIWTNVTGFFSNLWNDIKGIWNKVSTWFSNTVINPVKGAFRNACDSISGFFNGLWTGIKKGVVGAMNAVIGGIEKGINYIVNAINGLIGGFNKIVSWAAKVADVNWGGVSLLPKVYLSRISCYETGGFPDKASLFWAGENGIPELMGTVGGRTAVAGGEEITGIREAVYSTASQELQVLRQQNAMLRELINVVIQKETGISSDEIFSSVRKSADAYYNRTGNPAFPY